MIRLAAPALALLAATEVSALSCVRPDPFRALQAAQAAAEAYLVLHGTLTFDAAQMPQGVQSSRPTPEPVEARFSGVALGREGFAQPVVEAPVTLRPSCAGPWCGSIGEGTFLLFAEVTEAGYEVEIGPCGGWAFDQVPESVLEALSACLRREACVP